MVVDYECYFSESKTRVFVWSLKELVEMSSVVKSSWRLYLSKSTSIWEYFYLKVKVVLQKLLK